MGDAMAVIIGICVLIGVVFLAVVGALKLTNESALISECEASLVLRSEHCIIAAVPVRGDAPRGKG